MPRPSPLWPLSLAVTLACTPFDAVEDTGSTTPEDVESSPRALAEDAVAPAQAARPASAIAPAPAIAIAPDRDDDATPRDAQAGPPLTALSFLDEPRGRDPAALTRHIDATKQLLAATPESAPDYPELLFRLGLALRELAVETGSREHLERAAKAFEHLLQRPQYAAYARIDEALLLHAAGLAAQGRDEEMRVTMLRLVRDYPASPMIPYAYAAFGDFYFARDKLPEALRLYEKAAQFPDSPTLPYALYMLARCHERPVDTGEARYDRALDYYVRALQATESRRGLSPELAARLRARARLDLTYPYAQAGKPSKALAFFAKVGAGPGAQDETRAMLLALAGHYDAAGLLVESTFILKTLITSYPADAALCEWYARVYANARAGGGASVIAAERAALERLQQDPRWRGDPRCAAQELAADDAAP